MKNKIANLGVWGKIIILISSFLIIYSLGGGNMTDYMFSVFANTGLFFSLLLGFIFLAGLYVIIDRTSFFIFYCLIAGRLFSANKNKNIFDVFKKNAREFRVVSTEEVYTDEIIDHARNTAVKSMFDGQDVDWGRSFLDFLGSIAPTVGFMGTLVGLVESFQQLGLGGSLDQVLSGLALSMTTSLLGAIISVIFLTVSWLLGRYKQIFDNKLYEIIALAQQTDNVNHY